MFSNTFYKKHVSKEKEFYKKSTSESVCSMWVGWLNIEPFVLDQGATSSVLLFVVLRQGLICSSDWPDTHYVNQGSQRQRFICLCLPCAGDKDVSHVPRLCFFF